MSDTTSATPTIVAMGGGGFSMEPDNPLLDDYVLSLARGRGTADDGVARPRVCFIPTASGDSDRYVVQFYTAFPAERAVATHVSLFRRSIGDLAAFLCAQDVVYVGGGNTANMMATWRVHEFDAALRAAWESGVVMAGLSAGSLCWYEGGVTDSFGSDLGPIHDGLGFLPGSHAPHYDGEAKRRPVYQELVRSGTLAAGIAADDGVALRYSGTELVEVVSSRPTAQAYRLAGQGDAFTETPLAARYLAG